MFDWWNALTIYHQVFYIIAIPATLILILQTILLLFGFGHDSETDIDHDVDTDADHDIDGHDGADHIGGLRLLTVRGIVAFLAVCGWVGVALLDLGVSPPITILVSIVCGLAALFLVALMLRFSMKMQQSGNLDLANAVGVTGEVYVPIPEGGKGKVTLVVQERFMELDAICPAGELKTGRLVRVTGVTETNTLIVEPV